MPALSLDLVDLTPQVVALLDLFTVGILEKADRSLDLVGLDLAAAGPADYLLAVGNEWVGDRAAIVTIVEHLKGIGLGPLAH